MRITEKQRRHARWEFYAAVAACWARIFASKSGYCFNQYVPFETADPATYKNLSDIWMGLDSIHQCSLTQSTPHTLHESELNIVQSATSTGQNILSELLH